VSSCPQLETLLVRRVSSWWYVLAAVGRSSGGEGLVQMFRYALLQSGYYNSTAKTQ